MAIKTVGVLGCGLMGAGIAQVAAAAGFKTTVLEVNDGVLQKGLGRIDKFLSDGVAKGKVAAADREKTLANLKGTTAYARSERLRPGHRSHRRERRGQAAGFRTGRSPWLGRTA